MSQENVEIVKALNEAFNRRDWNRLTELIDPDVELHGTIGGLEEDLVVRGMDGIRRRFEIEDNEIWDEHRFEPQEFIDAGDQVVVLQREYQRGKSSGVELSIDTASVLHLRGGRIVDTWTARPPSKPPGCGSSGACELPAPFEPGGGGGR
jgi:ketosteroid isomerase-like protein